MPEGPSLVILKELIAELHLEGKTVQQVTGTTTLDKERMLGLKLVAVKTHGKHLLICFKDFALRIHLMMFGTYRINEGKPVEPRIGFIFDDAELNFYTCQLKYIDGDLNETYDWTVDIMSEKYTVANTVKKLKANESALLCDVLLDQSIFAGSGNIIKNEVLYRIGVQPSVKISDLSIADLKTLATETQRYAFDFLRWKKALVLKKHWEIYGKKKCPKGHEVIKEALGKNKRISFYCPICQWKKKAAVI
jgi:endonuclease-8